MPVCVFLIYDIHLEFEDFSENFKFVKYLLYNPNHALFTL